MAGVAVIIVAGGQGSRVGDGLPKQYRDLGGTPVLARTVTAFATRAEVSTIVVVRAREHAELCAAALDGFETASPGLTLSVVDGGASRTQSVRNGMEALAQSAAQTAPGAVLIHDAARPFVTDAVIDRVEAALLGCDAAAPALAIADALKHIGADGTAGDDAPRDRQIGRAHV